MYHKKFLLRCIVFIILTGVVVGIVNQLMMPKNYINKDWPSTNTFQNFYKLDKNTVDVVFLGSSHAGSSFNPQVIYDNYGIRSYNLASEQQSLLVSYYWLKEAFNYQSPKVVMIDTHTFFHYVDAYVPNDLNCGEASVRWAMDNMRFSKVKIEAAQDIQRLDPTQSALSFFLTNIRFHSRWTDIGKEDYFDKGLMEHSGVKGFAVLGGIDYGVGDYFFNAEDASYVDPEPMIKIAEEYLAKMQDLCEEHEAQLVFVNIPCAESVERYKATYEYACEYSIPYYDFNEESLYHALAYSGQDDKLGHPNYHGAEKISLYVGKLLRDEYQVPAVEDDSFEESRKDYQHKIDNITLRETTDFKEYLDLLANDRYCVLAIVPYHLGEAVDDEIADKWKALGFETDLRTIDPNCHYCAVKAEQIDEVASYGDIDMYGTVEDGAVTYRFIADTSIMLQPYQTFSMKLNGIEYSRNTDGINIVVYDKDFQIIADKVNVNLTTEDHVMSRY